MSLTSPALVASSNIAGPRLVLALYFQLSSALCMRACALLTSPIANKSSDSMCLVALDQPALGIIVIPIPLGKAPSMVIAKGPSPIWIMLRL